MSPTLGSVDAKSTTQQKQSKKDEPTDAQCKRVDVLLNKLVEKYPYRVVAGKVSGQSLYVCCVRLCNHKDCCFSTQDGSKPVPGGCGRSVHTSTCCMSNHTVFLLYLLLWYYLDNGVIV